MPKRSESFSSRSLLPLAAAFLIAATASAAAQQREPTMLQKLFGAIGLLEIPDDPIEYRERAPLVVPPSQALVEPRAPDDMATLNPDWPVDHGTRRGLTPSEIEAEKKADEVFYSGRPLMPNELQRGRISRAEAARRAAAKPGPDNRGTSIEGGSAVLSPAQLGFRGWGAKEEERVVFAGEPERRTLTDPPPGLRTPSAAAPYGIVSTKITPTKQDLFNRVTNEYPR